MTGNVSPAARILGSLRSADGQGVVRIEDRYDAKIDDVWSALTDPQHLADWVGEVAGDLRVGGEFRGSLTSGWEGTARVEECKAPRRLLLTMDVGEPGENVIEAMLTADGDQTNLVIEQRGLPLDYLAAFAAGLQVHAEDLCAHLAGRERCDIKARWDELIPAYKDLAAKVG